MITQYNPLKAPNPEEWLALDEDDRIGLVVNYHLNAQIEMPNPSVHAVIHVAVENQIAAGDEYPVKETLNRLIEEGLDRHDAVHAVGSVLTKYLWEMGTNKEAFQTPEYFDEVRELTAQKWLDEFG